MGEVGSQTLDMFAVGETATELAAIAEGLHIGRRP
jgi:hypothetical protein